MAQSPFDTPFDQLPNPKQVWLGKPGSYEEGLGKLAILTPEVVAAASASEIRCGRRVTMGWEMTKLDFPNLNRQPCHHQIVPLLGGVAFDDIYTMNPRKLREILLSSLLFIFFFYNILIVRQSKVASGTASAIFLRQYLVSLSACSMVEQPVKKSMIAKMIELVSSIGLERALQVLIFIPFT